MKRIIYLAFALLLMFGAQSCTEYNLIDTGEANGNHNTTMWEYFKGDPYNWDSLRVMEVHADLVPLFQGTSSYGKDITFFGITNHSIRRYLLKNDLKQVTDIPKAQCRDFILDCVLKKRLLLDEFTAGHASTNASEVIGTGGETFDMASGKKLWIYTFRSSYNGVPEMGPKQIHLLSPITTKSTVVASSNIQTLTGVVHSLDYNFTLSDF